jgi:hypothetical protein
VTCDRGEGSKPRSLACKLIMEEGMRVTEVTAEIRYCLRDLKLEE